MRIEERYRAALVALRDGQWETAATHLLSIAADTPTYRDVDRVLEVLQRTRSVSYWCAAFTIARERNAYEAAREALEQIAALAPALPRLGELRQALAEIAPADARHGLLQPDILPEPSAPDPGDSPDPQGEAPPAEDNTLSSLELDPLTELLFDDRWVELSARAGAGRPADGAAPDKAGTSDDPGPETADSQPPHVGLENNPTISPGDPPSAPVSDAEATASPDLMSGSTSPQPTAYPLMDTEPVPLPPEPEGEFIRIVPPASETEEPEMATDHNTTAQTPDDTPIRHRYSVLQVLGLSAFPLILAIVTVYVLFGQGAPTLSDMLRDVQTGAAITTTTELITAVDVQFNFPDDNDSAQAHLQEYARLAAVLAEEMPELETALSAWIETGQELATARTTVQDACIQAGSRACQAARQAVTSLETQADEQRAQVCALTTCPPAAPGSVHG